MDIPDYYYDEYDASDSEPDDACFDPTRDHRYRAPDTDTEPTE
jgi:hypothetical protein